MIFSQDDGNLLFYDRFYPYILEYDKTSQELLIPVMAPSQKTVLSYFYIINILGVNSFFVYQISHQRVGNMTLD